MQRVVLTAFLIFCSLHSTIQSIDHREQVQKVPRFNADQQAAVEAGNQEILTSAAAGSGKTTVMVQKILHTILNVPGSSISEFLVLTFTNDAARNMKEKLRSLLEEQAGAEAMKALSELESATIGTIHAFCQQLLKEYNDNTDATMEPRVLKESERIRMLDEALVDATESMLSQESPLPDAEKKDVHALLGAFDLEEIKQMVRDLYSALMGVPRPMEKLQKMVQSLPLDDWKQEIVRAVDLDLLSIPEMLDQESKLMEDPLALEKYRPVVESDRQILSALAQDCPELTDPVLKHTLIVSARESLMKAPSVRGLDDDTKAWNDQMKTARNRFKNADGVLAEAAARLEPLLNPDPYAPRILQLLHGLGILTRETARGYERAKLETGTIDYSDMEQTAYRVMSDPDKRDELLARYRYVYVDECQDVSEIQDAIIHALTGPGHQLFMVGDVKQSIYGFRHAVPALFMHYREVFSDAQDAPCRRIFFRDNYRSCQTVVDAVNEVFEEAMDRRITEMDYTPEDHLRANLPGEYGPVDVVLVHRDAGDETDKIETQCEIAGRYIQSMVATGSSASADKPYTYRDIVILTRKGRDVGNRIVENLQKMHIPAIYEGGMDFFGLSEVRALLALLSVIDNQHNDDALVGTLINAPFNLSPQELAEIRMADLGSKEPFWKAFAACIRRNTQPIDRRCTEIQARLDAWREKAAAMSVSDFVWWLTRETGMYASRGAFPDGVARQANLDVIYQRALDGERASQLRLSDFLSALSAEQETSQTDGDDHPTPGTGDDYVRVMTMHKSKGLEFPVVILMNLQTSMRSPVHRTSLRMNISASGDENPPLGLYLPSVRRRSHSKMDSYGRDAHEIRELRMNLAENTRLLYVAMTRAQQRLCMIGCVRDKDPDLWAVRDRAARIWKTRSMLDMIMPAVLGHMDIPAPGKSVSDNLWRLSCVEGQPITDSDEEVLHVDDAIGSVISEDAPMLMYLPETPDTAPVKTSVSTLVRDRSTGALPQEEETVTEKRETEEVIHTFRLDSTVTRPAFLDEEKASAVDIGSATHRFLRLLDLSLFREEAASPYYRIREEAERMEAEGTLSHEEARLIRYQGVSVFLESDLGQRMLQSEEVHREWSFTMQLAPDHPTLVQGIVDCAFLEEGQWVLIDYKTDRDTARDTFVPRHTLQMNWYRTALERLTHRPVREMWLYALRAGIAYPVPRVRTAQD